MTSISSIFANVAILRKGIGAIAVAALVAAGASVALRTSSPATAAPALDVSAPLTISRKPAKDLSPGPGIRLAKVSSQDGFECFRASRTLPHNGPTISETFCTH
ncbi:MAG: hypothetical protein AB7F96_08750 [Beijerinckiaceae bacterium]